MKEQTNKNNNLPKGWMKVKLGEITKVETGGTPPRRNPKYFQGGKIPWLKTQELNDGYIYSSEEKITEEGLINSNAKLFPINTVLIAMYGATVGKLGYLKTECSTNQAFAALLPNPQVYDSKFLFYLLLKERDKLISVASGAAQQNLNLSIIKNFEIFIPENINEQKRIADILSAFDDKIELNNKITKNLEETAQAIFREWFPKGLKTQNLKLDEWEIKDADEVFIFEKGIEPGSKYYSEEKKENYIPFYRVRDLDNQSGVDVYIPEKIANNKICKESDVLLSLDATVGRVKIGCSGAFSSGIRKVYSKNGFIKNSFIYFWLKTPYVQNTILEHASGTTILHASNAIKYLKFPLSKKVIKKIQLKVDPIFEKILQTLKENQKLSATRDLLLPKLMSGEIRV
jgi:type I restriction enzyme S subunit